MKQLVLLLLGMLLASPVLAQPDTDEGRTSLEKVQAFYLNVDVEGSLGLTSDPILNAGAIKSRLTTALVAAGLNVLEQTEVVDQAREPFLYVHVNMLDAGQGIVPFSISTQFYQRVSLSHKRGSIVASTWDTGLVGVASYDQLDIIAESAESSLVNFISDFQAVNP